MGEDTRRPGTAGTKTLTDEQREVAATIRTQAEELAAYIDQLGDTGTDLSEAKAVLLDLRDTAAGLASAAPNTR